MAARRQRKPSVVSSLAIASTGHGPTDRVLKQAESAVQELQVQRREIADTLGTTTTNVASAAAAIAVLQAQTTGRYLGRRLLTGTGSSTLAAGTCVVRLRGIGQGGGGGGGGVSGFGAGGSSGVLLDIEIGTPGTPLATLAISWTAGSGAGAGGSNAGGNGTAGADSTITINGTVYTMKGGGRGNGMPAPGAPITTAISNAPAGGTTSGGFSTYWPGGASFVQPGVAGSTGFGGSSPLGAGGLPRDSSGGVGLAGDPGGFGGGGSGGAGTAVGGAGAAGGFEIKQFT